MLDLKGLLSKARLPMDITRRGFLEVSTVAAAVAAMNAARAQTGAQPYIILSAPKGILIADPSLCVSCHRCELACTEFNDGKATIRALPASRSPAERHATAPRAPTPTSPPQSARTATGPVWFKTPAASATHPVPCANACPQGAIQR